MPTNFGYVIDGVLAGMERPGTYASLEEDLAFLRDRGIGAIVSLTEVPLLRDVVEAQGFRYLHLPVGDFTPPTLDQVAIFAGFLTANEREGVPVVVHCAAGHGRTGTMLACALVLKGAEADEAIRQLRELRPYSIETREQEDLVWLYERATRRRNTDAAQE